MERALHVHAPSVMSARLVSTLPSMNLMTARMTQIRPLTMDTLNKKPSWEEQTAQRPQQLEGSTNASLFFIISTKNILLVSWIKRSQSSSVSLGHSSAHSDRPGVWPSSTPPPLCRNICFSSSIFPMSNSTLPQFGFGLFSWSSGIVSLHDSLPTTAARSTKYKRLADWWRRWREGEREREREHCRALVPLRQH